MRALLIVRGDAATKRGGDVVHAEHAAAALAELGVEVTLAATDAPDARGFDVAHVFGVFEPPRAAAQIAAVRATATPLVLSPIWLDLRPFFTTAPQVERALAAPSPVQVERRLARLRHDHPLLAVGGRAARAAERRLAVQRELMLQADALLPASEVEAYLYGERLRIANVPCVVARLGVDPAAFASAGAGKRSGIITAGRIESKKNQAALLYALRDAGLDVTLVGDAHDAAYLALCKRWATPRTRFAGGAAHGDVLRLMRTAAVHAHPSWLESPGLSSLEAAATGARIVAGDRGCEREYFGPDVDYADPADPGSIASAVTHALARGPRAAGDRLDQRLRTLTWRSHAEATLDAYERARARRSR